jgi:hypothetical protein
MVSVQNTTAPTQSETTSTSSDVAKKTVGFLEDDNGNKSCMRLMSVIALLSAIAFSVGIFWQTSHPVPGNQPQASEQTSNEFYIVISFLSVSFGGKAIQKFAEK